MHTREPQKPAAPSVTPVSLPPSRQIIWRVEGEYYFAPDPVSQGVRLYRKAGDCFVVFASLDRTGMLLFHDVDGDVHVEGIKIDPVTGVAIEEARQEPPVA